MRGKGWRRRTSTVSKTFTMPGWRSVRNFRNAFFASGSRDLLALTSKEKMLHLEPSSCARPLVADHPCRCWGKAAYSSCSVLNCPDRLVDVNPLAEGVGKSGSFGDGGRYGALQEIHGGDQSLFENSQHEQRLKSPT